MAMQQAMPSDPTAVCQYSSIALLQERFRRLERAKEMREERETFRLLSETLRVNIHPTCSYDLYEQFFQVESYQLTAPQTTLKLQQPCLLFMRRDAENKETPLPDLANMRSKDAVVMHRRIVFDDEYSDVDTSLHL